jgi:outer membrane lipoprotein-sorting protein
MKKILSILLLAVLIIGIVFISGCAKEAENIIDRAKESSSSIENYDLDMTMDIGMKVMDQDIVMLMNMESTNFIDPVKSRLEMSIDMGVLGKQETKSYTIQDGDVIKIYTYSMGEWTLQELSGLKNMEDALANSNFKVFINNFDSFKEVGTDKIDGKDVVVYEGVIKGSSLSEVMKTSGLLSSLQADMTMDYEVVFGEDMGDMPIKFWIEKETAYPVKYSMDMSMVMNRLMTVIYAEAIPGTNVEVVVSKCLVEMTMKNINKVEDFKIPEEVLMVK